MSETYSLLPFRFSPFHDKNYLLTSFSGDYCILPQNILDDFVNQKLTPKVPEYSILKSRLFLVDSADSPYLDLLANQYRTKQSFLSELTSLFMIVTTLRCNHSCRYCQASSHTSGDYSVDMSEEIASKCVDFILSSPSQNIKIEFQGGEPLFNFQQIKNVISIVKERRGNKNIAFVIATNLSLLNDEILEFLQNNEDIYLSTSLDGPAELHNYNRPWEKHDSHQNVRSNIQQVNSSLGPCHLAALMTTTRKSLSYPEKIIDEYVDAGFSSIFLRPLNPYGLATHLQYDDTYTVKEWLDFYKKTIAYILKLNRQGLQFREEYMALLLRRILTPFPTGFVDLQSPAGLGIAGIIINYNGDVFPSDEGRMLAEMGDETFRLGNVQTDSYDRIIRSKKLIQILRNTMTEVTPMCHECVFQPYCGCEPIRHYVTQSDIVGHKPTSDFCQKHKALFMFIFDLLESKELDDKIIKLWSIN